ncbi:hypothetical protein [Vibrio quintilis]|uniref:Uncharacterized protein n=1 Tax=Vibrio quintilis TaxID=1117707 RepID=A0A1M7Z251_9VIBR|nr:hypothetical protein [Vibrio quintilis]SHO58973.1 hypothetical protein VQ7734_04748 [Vibrio quintilis]
MLADAISDNSAYLDNFVEVNDDKFMYLFGKVTEGRQHNIDRSGGLALDFKRLGLRDDEDGREILRHHFNSVGSRTDNIIRSFDSDYGTQDVHESLLFGPSGKAARLESTFIVGQDGSKRFTSAILKGGPDNQGYQAVLSRPIIRGDWQKVGDPIPDYPLWLKSGQDWFDKDNGINNDK